MIEIDGQMLHTPLDDGTAYARAHYAGFIARGMHPGRRHTAVVAGASYGIEAYVLGAYFEKVIAIERDETAFRNMMANFALAGNAGDIRVMESPLALDNYALRALDLLYVNFSKDQPQALQACQDTIYKHRPLIVFRGVIEADAFNFLLMRGYKQNGAGTFTHVEDL